MSNAQVKIELPNFAARRVTVQTSTNLGVPDSWSLWQVPGNNGIPWAPGLTNFLTGPSADPKRFFKIQIEEE